MRRLVVLEVLEESEPGPAVTLAELRGRLGGEVGLLPDPRSGAPLQVSLVEFRGAAPDLRLRVTVVAAEQPTPEELILLARIPSRRARALSFEHILEESRGRTGFEEMDALPVPPTLRRMRAELARLVAEGRVERIGSGGRDDPYRYWTIPATSD